MYEYCADAGKRGFELYADALAYLESKSPSRNQLPGSVYTCPSCDLFHVTRTHAGRARRVKGRGNRARARS